MTWRELWPVWLTFSLLFGFGVLGLWVIQPEAHKATAMLDGKDLNLDLSSLDSTKPTLFSFPMDAGNRVEFFVERGPDTNITVAFASCRRCYRSGHYIRAGQIFCGHCNQTMERVRPGEAPGTDKDCKQIPIPFDQSGDRVVVRADAVRAAFAQSYAPMISENGTPLHESHK
jgi:uncharacterized membrane protein